jgi:serine/threonine protein kinase
MSVDEGERTIAEGLPPEDDPERTLIGPRPEGDKGDGPEATIADGGAPSADPKAPTDLDLPQIPDVTLHRVLGRGGQGVVYEANQDYLDRRVAVKFLLGFDKHPTFTGRFQREAKILAGMKHPNIVGCYSAGTSNGHCYMVMEFIDGPNLAEWIRENGPLAVEDAVELGIRVADALHHAYQSQIIHRDVKPENVLLEPKEGVGPDVAFPYRPKLADLGLARSVSDQPATNLTMAGTVMGSPSTMAPEQFSDPDGVDFRADIYALGCVMFHSVTGKPAFKERNVTATIAKKLQTDGPDIEVERPDLPKKISKYISQMMNRDREQRPKSYLEIIDTLRSILRELRGEPDPTDPRFRILSIAALAALVLVAGLWALFSALETEVDLIVQETSVGEGEPVVIEVQVEGTEDYQVTWEQTAPDTPRVLLPDLHANPLQFFMPAHTEPYQLTLEATVVSGDEALGLKLVTFDVAATDEAPEIRIEAAANADEDQDVVVRSLLRHPEGACTFAWSVTPAEFLPDLDLTAESLAFRVPNRSAPYQLSFELIVTDPAGQTARDVHSIQVAARDDVPIAALRTLAPPEEGSEVTLDASSSRDPDGGALRRFEFRQSKGDEVPLQIDAARATFRAPDRIEPYALGFEVRVLDEGGAFSDWTGIDLAFAADNDPPRNLSLEATPNQVQEGREVLLIAGAEDPEGGPLEMLFTAPPGVEVSTETEHVGRARLIAPYGLPDGRLVLGLEVSDGVEITPLEKTIRVLPDPALVALGPGQVVPVFGDYPELEGDHPTRGKKPPFGPDYGSADGSSAAMEGGHGILVKSARDGIRYLPYHLPRTDLTLAGEFAPRPARSNSPIPPCGVGLRFPFGELLQLRLDPGAPIGKVELLLTRTGDAAATVLESSDYTYERDTRVSYELEWVGGSVKVGIDRPGDGERVTWSVDPRVHGIEQAPATLILFAEGGACNFHSLEMRGR